MSWIQTYTGRAFNPLDPEVDAIDVRDIAHHLSLTCRYNGAVRKFYSVAEHCVLLSHRVSPENAAWALLHDATEAYIGDMVWPLKEELPAFKRIEDGLMRAICARYGLDPNQPKEVAEFDRRIVLDERDQLMAPPQRLWSALEGFTPLDVTVYGWYPEVAEETYLLRFAQLVNS